MKTKGIMALLMACMLLSSCMVGRKKYEASEAARWAAIYSRDSLSDLLDGSRILASTLMKDTALLKSSLKNYQSLLASNRNENQKLNTSLSQKERELAEREKTIAQLQEMINAQNAKVQALLNNVKDALLGFSSDELTVREEGGKVYVAMSDKLLFESGKAIVNEQGKRALG